MRNLHTFVYFSIPCKIQVIEYIMLDILLFDIYYFEFYLLKFIECLLCARRYLGARGSKVWSLQG